MKNIGFYLFIVDEDQKLFNDFFTYDDSRITEIVAQEQRRGRHINCVTVNANENTLALEIKGYENQRGYKHTKKRIW